MLEQNVEKLYFLFRGSYYREMVKKIGPREGSLSATESYCIEIIYLLNNPTVSRFASYLNISVPNANYKVNSLEKKGYIERVPSETDRREIRLCVTQKFLDYYGLKDATISYLMAQVKSSFTPEEIVQLDAMIDKIICLMPSEDSHD